MDDFWEYVETPENSPANSHAALSISELPSHLSLISTDCLIEVGAGLLIVEFPGMLGFLAWYLHK